MSRRIAVSCVVFLTALSITAPASGATTVQHFQAEMHLGPNQGGGYLTLDVVFRNSRRDRKSFTPRVVTRTTIEGVPLTCRGSLGDSSTQLFLTTSSATWIKVRTAPPPHTTKPKRSRYAFRFDGLFLGFAGTIAGTIDRNSFANRKAPPRAHGSFTITDLDWDAANQNCATQSLGRRSWSAPRPCLLANETGSLPSCPRPDAIPAALGYVVAT